MALTEETVYQIEVTRDEHVQVRATRVIYDDGVEISSSHHRKVIMPGDDYSAESTRIKRICQQMHSTEAIAYRQAFNTLKQARENQTIVQTVYDADSTQANLDALNAAIATRQQAKIDFDVAKVTYKASVA